MPFRFVHTADIHLDSPLRSLALRSGEGLAERIGAATRRAFAAIIDLCIAEEVDALMIVGDLYDGSQTSMKTARFLAAELRRLDEAGIRAFITRGNHDAESRITRELTLPDSVKVFGGRAGVEVVVGAAGGRDVAVHGISFAGPKAPDNLVSRFKPAVSGAVNIGLLHTSLGGAPGHDVYAPCSVADLAATGFDYWALGHVHKRSVVSETPLIIMPGMPQGRHVNEAGMKSVTLVTIDDEGAIRQKEHLTSVVRFERLCLDLSGVEDWRTMLDTVREALRAERTRTESDALVARLSLTGATPLSWRLRRDAPLLLAEVQEQATTVGNVWIDKLEVQCEAPSSTGTGDTANPVLELRNLIREEVAGSSDYLDWVRRLVLDWRGQLPAECRPVLGGSDPDEAALDDLAARLIREGTEEVLAQLHGRTTNDGDDRCD